MRVTGLVGTLAIGLAATAAVSFTLSRDMGSPSTEVAADPSSTNLPTESMLEGLVLDEFGAVPHARDAAKVPGRSVPDDMEWVGQTPPVEVDGIGMKTDDGVFVGVVLPYDTREGDQVSTVVVAAAPPGETEASFEGMVIVDPQGKNHDVVPGEFITFVAAGTMAWVLLDGDGDKVGETNFELKERHSRDNQFQDEPIVARSNQVIDIPGDFNGDMSDTKVTIGGQEATVIAENPRGALFAVPDLGERVGELECIVEEAGEEHEIPMVALSLSIEGPRTMRLGQTADMTITVNGLRALEDLPEGQMADALYIKYRNDTPNTIGFPNHNVDSHAVDISQIKDGSYSFEVPITAEAPGTFVVTAWSWVYLEGSYGTYCTSRQCCLVTCGTCTEGWLFCKDDGTVNCTKVDKKKIQCGRCGQANCGNNHSGGAACGHWWCNCPFGACTC